MQDNLFRRVKEASYLIAERAWSYRPILRYFYMQHERMRDFLFPEEIYEYVRGLPPFKEYTMEELHQDLDALVKWGNLIARQEMGSARTVQEFKKKRFRYQCTPYTVEFERMLQRLEHMGDSFGGSLERTQFERLYHVLRRISSVVRQEQRETDEECAQLWDDLMSYFRQIRRNTSDYMAYVNSEEVADRMQTEAFLAYKDQFTAYLRDFIVALQRTALQIQDSLAAMELRALEPFFRQVLAHQGQVFRLEQGSATKVQQDPMEEFRALWLNLKTWFLGNEHGESEFEMLQHRTDEAIRRITRVVQRMGERHQQFRSRKRDYLHLAKWFDRLESIEEAHRLSSVAFGVFHTRHLHLDHSPTEDIYVDVWEEEPMVHRTNPRIRQYREKTRAGAIVDHRKKREAMLQEYLEERRNEEELVAHYMQGDAIRVRELPVVEPFVRKLLLTWLGKALVRSDRTIKTEYGRKVRVVVHHGQNAVLRSLDGTLIMPDVTFQFVEDETAQLY